MPSLSISYVFPLYFLYFLSVFPYALFVLTRDMICNPDASTSSPQPQIRHSRTWQPCACVRALSLHGHPSKY